jgi:hypothetical protein
VDFSYRPLSTATGEPVPRRRGQGRQTTGSIRPGTCLDDERVVLGASPAASRRQVTGGDLRDRSATSLCQPWTAASDTERPACVRRHLGCGALYEVLLSFAPTTRGSGAAQPRDRSHDPCGRGGLLITVALPANQLERVGSPSALFFGTGGPEQACDRCPYTRGSRRRPGRPVEGWRRGQRLRPRACGIRAVGQAR